MNQNNRLQFVHHQETFKTSDDAKAYVLRAAALGRAPLMAEPMVVTYGSADKPSVMLAIGAKDGESGLNVDNQIFFIDAAAIENDIKKLNDMCNNDGSRLTDTIELLHRLITACGVNEDGTYSADESDQILKIARNLKDAEHILSNKLQEETARATAKEKEITIHPENTQTIKFNTTATPEGTTLKADVVLSNGHRTGDIYNNNIIRVDEEGGLCATVRYEDNKLIFSSKNPTVDGKYEREFQLPAEVHLVDGKYDKEHEQLVLTLSDDSTVNIDLNELLSEWTVEELPLTPIVLHRERLSEPLIRRAHDRDIYQDILSADVRLSSNDDNILVRAGNKEQHELESLYVKGTADNIQYKTNDEGKKITVYDALNIALKKVSKEANNIIAEKADGLYANVDLSYDKAKNVLTFSNGIGKATEIQLVAASVLDRTEYRDGNIVLIFILSDGSKKEINIPIKDIVTDFTIENDGHDVTLTRTNQNSKYSLSASVNILNENDNILKTDGKALYVLGTAENIKYGQSTVGSELDTLTGSEEVANSVKNYYTRAIKKAEDLVNVEKARAEAAENINKQGVMDNDAAIDDLTDTVNQKEQKLSQEIETAKRESTQAIHNEKDRAEAAEGKIAQDAKDLVAAEAQRTDGKIVKASSDLTDIVSKEVSRATQAEGEIIKSVTAERARIDLINGTSDKEGSVRHLLKNTISALAADINEEHGSYISEIHQKNGVISAIKKPLPTYEVEGTAQRLVDAAINNLDAVVASEADDNVSVTVHQANGLITKVNASVKDNVVKKAELEAEIANRTSKDDEINRVISQIKLEGSGLTYKLVVDGKDRGTINIPKDNFLQDAYYDAMSHTLILNMQTSSSEELKPIEIPVGDLVDVYEAGNGLSLDAQNTFAVKIDAQSEKFIDATASGVKLTGISKAIDDAVLKEQNRAIEKENDIQTQAEAAVLAEKQRAVTAEDNIKGHAESLIKTEHERAIAAETTIKGNVSTNAVAIQDEVKRAIKAESDINNKITELSVNDSAVTNTYVTSVSQINGKIAITREKLPIVAVSSSNVQNNPIVTEVNAHADNTYNIVSKLNISKTDGNLLAVDNGALYASNNAVHLYGVYGKTQDSLQVILNKIHADIINAAASGGSVTPEEVKKITEDIQAIQNDINVIKEQNKKFDMFMQQFPAKLIDLGNYDKQQEQGTPEVGPEVEPGGGK